MTGAPNSGGATSQMDLCIVGASGTDTITNLDGTSEACTGPNAVGSDSYQVLIIGNPANATGNTAAENMNLQIGVANGTKAPGRVIVAVEDDGAGATINSLATNSPTIQGHPSAAGAAAVAAAFFPFTPRCGTTPAQLEGFSSEGGGPILFDSTGARLATPIVRQKPNFVGPDGVNNTFLGFTLASGGITDPSAVASCKNDAELSEFLWNIGRHTTRRSDRCTDAAGQLCAHAESDLRQRAECARVDGTRHVEPGSRLQLRLRIHSGRCGAGQDRAGCADGDARCVLGGTRRLDDFDLVGLTDRDEL